MELEPFNEYLTAEAVDQFPILIRWLRSRLPEQSAAGVKKLILTGKIRVNGQVVQQPERRLKSGQEVALIPNAPRADRPLRLSPVIYHLDAHVVVCEKPVGILTTPFGGDHDTLIERAKRVIPRIEKRGTIPPLGAVHRLDKEATGLVLFARNVPAQRHLQKQFEERSVERGYLGLVHGPVGFQKRTIQSILVRDRGDGLKGSSREAEPQGGREAITHVEALEVLADLSLLRCHLETGRTHQIRIHLAEAGHPLVGESVYIRDYRKTLLRAPRMMLHAATLGFIHPVTGQALRFESPMPEEMSGFLKKARRAQTVGSK